MPSDYQYGLVKESFNSLFILLSFVFAHTRQEVNKEQNNKVQTGITDTADCCFALMERFSHALYEIFNTQQYFSPAQADAGTWNVKPDAELFFCPPSSHVIW